MAKRKDDDPKKVNGIILTPQDIDDITKRVKENALDRADEAVRKQNIKLVSDPHSSEIAKQVNERFDNLEQRLGGLERDLEGSVPPTRDEVRAVINKHAPNLSSKALGEMDTDELAVKIKKDLPNVSDDVIEEILMEKLGRDFGKEMALLEAVDKDKLPTEEDVARWGKMFTTVIMANERGEDPDLSEYKQPVATAVEAAVERYAASLKTPATDNLHKRLHEMAGLFTPDPGKTRPENRSYRFLTRRVKSRISEDNIWFTQLFPDALTYDKEIDAAAVEKQMRRIDTELRELDSVARGEFMFNFVDEILSTESEGDTAGYRGWRGDEQFSMLSEESRRVVRQVVLFYFYTRHHFKVSQAGWQAVNRQFNEEALEKLYQLQNEAIERPYYVEAVGAIRYVKEAEYKLLLQLPKALYNALPDSFRDSVEAAMSVAKIPRPDITSANPNTQLVTASKYLRNAFIAISQNRGSLETFFTALYKFYSLLDTELNQKVEIANYMVALYDSLYLSIGPVLNESRKRILEEPLF
jgi:hypothetical protein